MADRVDIMVSGTGAFAARIVCDLAATAARPITIAIVGRNPDRLAWLRTAANARAFLYNRPAEIVTRSLDLLDSEAVAKTIAADRPRVFVQAASSQPSSVISTTGDAWSRLVAEGGLSATAVFQARLSMRMARALRDASHECHFINSCFPDVANSMIIAAGLPIACGVGNVGILSNAFSGTLDGEDAKSLRVLAHYQTLGAWRRPSTQRSGPAPRVWIQNHEIENVFERFAEVQLTPEPAIEISGASGVPLMIAMAEHTEWRGHVPGPRGLPGGYPVAFSNGVLDLDLPTGLSTTDAVHWNSRFEEENGLVVRAGGEVRYTGRLYERLRAESPSLAAGFAVGDLEQVYDSMVKLRARLQSQSG